MRGYMLTCHAITHYVLNGGEIVASAFALVQLTTPRKGSEAMYPLAWFDV